jgi:Protein of unknown function (DUF2817)
MNSLDSFSTDYQQARRKFLAAAAVAKGTAATFPHPEPGPDNGALSTDVAWFGPRDAERVLVMISATHGVEGFAGSGAQIDWLTRGEAQRLPTGVAALLIHAINPYGFAWLRRVTHENVDLNRNWIDFDQPVPGNAGYDELAAAICPQDWSTEGRARSNEVLAAYAVRHGKGPWQQAISGGQYHHPKGIFYGGSEPTWSRRTLTGIYAEYLRNAAQVAIIDFHTGLGPWGLGERIVTGPRQSDGFVRAARWYGNGVVSPYDGTSSSAPIVGDNLTAAIGLLPRAQVTAIALEFGTLPIELMLDAVRADAWLHAYGTPGTLHDHPIKTQIRSAFYGEAPDWKGMIAGQALLTCRQAIGGLCEAA